MKPTDKVTLTNFCEALHLDENDLVMVTQIGSRVYGTTTDISDWDFVSVVVDGFFQKYNLSKKNSMRDNGYISTTLTEVTDWKKDLDMHKPSAVISHYTPPQFVWKDTLDLEFKLSLPKLKTMFVSQSASRWQKAKTVHFAGRDYIKMRKWLVHAFRWLLLAKQLVLDPQLKYLDFTCGNLLYYEIISDQSEDWNHFEEVYK
eukprot:TRINITY_DN9480_c0_g1_i4.p2 TRINITY_DN9480_c0_g1~~TRINITY_DN9480_c0_g1_i4.p2  ORF type:complete len:217 (-),score=52.39 TRINITY_DN9480_c0_g1_i4:1060-1665(-)